MSAGIERVDLSSVELEQDKVDPPTLDHSRPSRFLDYPGQDKAKHNLIVYVEAAKMRQKPLDHVILHGPPGLGKTTLARIVAHELDVPFYQTSGPSIDRPGDLAGILAGVEERGVLFIDEIHRLPITVEEILYSAMEDYCVDILVGQGPSARTVQMPVNPFTLIGATTKMASLSSPLTSRFGIQEHLEFYNDNALSEILIKSAESLEISITTEGAYELAGRSRGTPRIAKRLLKRACDFADYHGKAELDRYIVDLALNRLDIDRLGLDRMDRRILQTISERYNGGPVGIEALAATIGEERSTIEEVYEPYLTHKGLLVRGARGRQISDAARLHLNSCER